MVIYQALLFPEMFQKLQFKYYSVHKINNRGDKVFKKWPSKICGRQPLKNLKRYGLPKADHAPSKKF